MCGYKAQSRSRILLLQFAYTIEHRLKEQWNYFVFFHFHVIMAYSSTPYVGMTPKKMVATLKLHKWHARNLYVRLVKGLHEPDQAVLSASMSNGIVNFAGEHRWSTRLASR